MIANKFLFIILFCTYVCSSQTKNDDAYYILNSNHKDYVLVASGKEINEVSKPLNIKTFYLYNKSQYLEREKQVEQDKKDGKFMGYQFYKRPKELVFNVVTGSAKNLTYCDIDSLNTVGYKWIEMNTWKENNPNILFKDLYFLLKTEKNNYLKFKVTRTIIAR